LTHPNSGFLGQIRTTYDWQGNKRAASGTVPKDSIQIRVVTVDTAKHFIILIETLLSVHKAT